MKKENKESLLPTNLRISKRTLALLNQLEGEEAGRRGSGGMTHEGFMRFLLFLYIQVRGDDIVLTLANEKAKKEGK